MQMKNSHCHESGICCRHTSPAILFGEGVQGVLMHHLVSSVRIKLSSWYRRGAVFGAADFTVAPICRPH
jgi:hypothetical protein